MLDIIISLLTFVLILISLFMVLVILMQRANTNAGMGSAFGGGVAESAFGTETTNVLVKATKWSAVAFFLISLTLFLLYMSRVGVEENAPVDDLPDIPVVEQTVPEQLASPEVLVEEAQQVVEDTVNQSAETVDAFTGETLPASEAPEDGPTP